MEAMLKWVRIYGNCKHWRGVHSADSLLTPHTTPDSHFSQRPGQSEGGQVNRLCSFHGVVCRKGNAGPGVRWMQNPSSSASPLCDLGQIFNLHKAQSSSRMHGAESGDPTVVGWKLNVGNYLTHESS